MTTITVPRAVLEQALEALEQSETLVPYEGFGMLRREAERKHEAAMAALKAALEQPEQEPVAHTVTGKLGDICHFRSTSVRKGDTVYTTPPRREWRSLSEEEIAKVWCGAVMAQSTKEPGLGVIGFARAIEAALKEKNQ